MRKETMPLPEWNRKWLKKMKEQPSEQTSLWLGAPLHASSPCLLENVRSTEISPAYHRH